MASIRLNKKDKTLKIVNRKETIKLKQLREEINLKHTGKPGPKGDQGDPGSPGAPGADGVGIPDGGNTGEVLKKSSNSDYDVAWGASESEDKHFTQPFTFLDTVVVNHNLGKYPAVSVFDSSGSEIVGSVEYNDTSSATVSFTHPFTGTIICN